MHWNWGVLFVSLVGCGTTDFGRYESPYSTRAREDEAHPIPRLSVDELFRAFRADPKAAEATYAGRVIEVTGTLGMASASGDVDSSTPEEWLSRIRPASEKRSILFRLTGSLPEIHGVDGTLSTEEDPERIQSILGNPGSGAVGRGRLRRGGPPFFILEECSIVASNPSPAEDRWGKGAGLVINFFRGDRKTGRRIYTLLSFNGIEFAVTGGVGFSVSVPKRDAVRARQVLRAGGLGVVVSEENEDSPVMEQTLIEVANPEYSEWKRFPVNSSRTFQGESGSRVIHFTDRLLEVAPSVIILERTSAGQSWRVRVFPHFTSSKAVAVQEGEEELTIGRERLLCHWVRTGSREVWEKTWYSSSIPGGWAKRERAAPGASTQEVDTVLEFSPGP